MMLMYNVEVFISILHFVSMNNKKNRQIAKLTTVTFSRYTVDLPSLNESTAGADASVEALKLYHI